MIRGEEVPVRVDGDDESRGTGNTPEIIWVRLLAFPPDLRAIEIGGV